jgi:hypothetical protein
MILPSLLASSPWEGYLCWSKCGRRTRPFQGGAFRQHRTNVGVLPFFFNRSSSERPRLPSTARIERAHSDRARSASKEDTWPLPLPPLEAL